MKAIIRTLAVASLVTAVAITASADVSPKLKEFGTGPAKWIMTPEEQAQWKKITTDADAQAFIDLFWARRDPTPATPANEARDRFDALVAAANERFKGKNVPGALSELGHVFIVLGPPTGMANTDPARNIERGQTRSTGIGGSAVSDARGVGSDAVSATVARQRWVYERSKMQNPFFEGPRFEVEFTDQFGNHDWKIVTGRFDVYGSMKKVIQASIISPNLTEAPKPAPSTATTRTTTTTSTVSVTTPVTGLPALSTEAYKAAVDAAKGGGTGKGNVVFAEFLTQTGDYFAPVGLYLPKSAGVSAADVETIFGTVLDSNGNPVVTFESAEKAFDSNGDVLADESLSLPAGSYTAIIGIGKAGQPLAVASRKIELKGIDKTAGGTTPILLSNNLSVVTEAAPVKAPFAFGTLRIVPKGDLVFSNKDELGYFIQVFNPGIDPATNLPNIQSKLELSGGKLSKPVIEPLGDAKPISLTGSPGPGSYAILASIPLSQMKTLLAAGNYTLKIRLIDTINKQTYNLEQSFKIVE